MAEASSMGNSALSFSFPTHALRVVMRDGEPWFVAADVCAAVGIKNYRDSVDRLDDDEKGVASTDTLGGQQEMLIVNESGLNAIILRCRDAMTPGTPAHKYRKWVTSEVLPAIRAKGRYEHPNAQIVREDVFCLTHELQAAQAQVQNLQARLLQSQARQLRLMGSVIGLQKSRSTRHVHDIIIRMERQGAPRTAIIAASGYTSNHVRQIIFRARERGDLPALDAAPAAQAALFEGA